MYTERRLINIEPRSLAAETKSRKTQVNARRLSGAKIKRIPAKLEHKPYISLFAFAKIGPQESYKISLNLKKFSQGFFFHRFAYGSASII